MTSATLMTPELARPAARPPDASGRERLSRNVLASWAAQLVAVAAGFVMPRMIDDHLGQGLLGVWDFGWAIVGYFGLAQAGIGASVNRYVAKHRAAGDTRELCRTLSSVTGVQLAVAGLVTLGTLALVALIPSLFGHRLGADVQTARWVVLLLGLNLAEQMAFNPNIGVITGCHRWDLHYMISASADAFTLLLMILLLTSGGGLVGLAAAHLIGSLLADVTRTIAARRVCPELRLRLSDLSLRVVGRQLSFGGKILVPRAGDLLLNQTVNLLILGTMGPAALALYCRPLNLTRHVGAFTGRFAFVLTPVASSLQAMQRKDELRDFFLSATRYGGYIAFPMVVTLVIQGDLLVRLWMGNDYSLGWLPAVLAISGLMTAINEPVFRFMSGLNAHGMPGLMKLAGAIASVSLAAMAVWWLNLGLVGVGLAVAIPMVVVNGVLIPRYACRLLGLSSRQYLAATVYGPVRSVLPLAACLLAGRVVFPHSPAAAFLSGFGIGMAALAVVYWQTVVPSRLKESLLARVPVTLGRRREPV